MMKRCLLAVMAAGAVVFFSGCISFQYQGKKEASPSTAEQIRVFEDATKIKRSYTVLGQATVSGNYQEISRDRMIDKLTSEARECGADAVLVIEQQVVPAGEGVPAPRFMTAFDYDDVNHGWSELYRDVDQNFLNPKRAKPQGSSSGSRDFRRIIRAEFLKYSGDQTAPVPAEKK